MKNDTFTTDDYLKAIKRELGKRATTYPKIIAKMEKRKDDTKEISKVINEQTTQIAHLDYARRIIQRGWVLADSNKEDCLSELIRELKMRKSYYPRLIYFKRIDQDTANYEIAVWESLTRWFAKEYLDLDELPTKRKKKL